MSSKLHSTRYPALKFTCEAPGQWTIIDAETLAPIGAKYKSKSELLADLRSFAQIRGYEEEDAKNFYKSFMASANEEVEIYSIYNKELYETTGEVQVFFETDSLLTAGKFCRDHPKYAYSIYPVKTYTGRD